METIFAGLKSLAVRFPNTVRTNDYYRNKHPDIVAAAEQRALARLWSKDRLGSDPFAAAMEPYITDPFRGTVERRVLAPGETALSLEVPVARNALAAMGMSPSDVDMILVCSFLPDQLGVGNAAFLARELGVRRPAWNLESSCSSALIAYQTACALVQSRQCKNVLVVISCTYSRVTDDTDTLGWFLGDAAGAFVVGAVGKNEGLLGQTTINTTETCDTFYYRAEPRVRIQCTPSTGRILHETALGYLSECCDGALKSAGLKRRDVDFFVFNTPTAWHADFATRALGIEPARTIDTYPLYANVGPALPLVNAHRAASLGRIKRGDVVLFYSVGSVSTTSAVVTRWSDVALFPVPS
jgi:3-oxoacyl-[acyl-carrier-protein] synthase-3